MVRAKADELKQQDVHDMGDKAKRIWLPANQQFSQTFLTGRKGPTTPTPSWKMYENPFYEGIMAAVQTDAPDAAVSARKLAANLWGLQQQQQQQQSEFLNSSKTAPESNPQPSEILTNSNFLHCPPSPSLSNSSLNSAKPSIFEAPTAPPKQTDKIGKTAQTNRQLAALKSHMQRLLEKRAESKDPKINSLNNYHPNGVEAQRQDLASLDISNVLKHSGVGDPHELLKALSCIHDLEEQNTWSTSLAEALLVELDHAGNSVQELEVQYKAAQKEIESLQKKIAEARSAWRSKEQEKIKAAVQAAREEVEEEERKSKKRLEVANKKLIKELADANAALSKERKAKELIEDVCDELAREMAEDKAEVEELRRESAMVREEVEEERKMLQVAELLREERVQIKLIEAQHELEERIAALNNLKVELEDFLRSEAKNYPKHQQNISNAESLCIAVEALLIDKTSLLSGYKDERITCDMQNIQLGSCTADMSRYYEAQGSKISENGTFLKEKKSRFKSSKHKSRTKLFDGSKRGRTRSKSSKKGSLKDQANGWEGANASESNKCEGDVSVESDYAKLAIDQSVNLSSSEDAAVNFDVHHIPRQIDSNTEHARSECTNESDLQNKTVIRSPIWRSNTLATEKGDLKSEESAANQQERGASSLKPFVSSASTIHTNNWAFMESKNQHNSRATKGSTEEPKNGLKARQEKQQKGSAGKF